MAADTRRARREKRLKLMIRTAARLIRRDGVEQFSLRSLARELDYSPAAIYEYFENKEAIVEAVRKPVRQRLLRVLTKAAPEGEATTRLVAVGRAYIDFAQQHPNDFDLLFRHLPGRRGALADAVPEGSPYELVLELATQIAGPGSGEMLAYSVWAFAHGAATLKIDHLKRFDGPLSRGDEAALRALIDGYVRVPA